MLHRVWRSERFLFLSREWILLHTWVSSFILRQFQMTLNFIMKSSSMTKCQVSLKITPNGLLWYCTIPNATWDLHCSLHLPQSTSFCLALISFSFFKLSLIWRYCPNEKLCFISITNLKIPIKLYRTYTSPPHLKNLAFFLQFWA